MAPKIQVEVPSYEQAKALPVELRVEGEDGFNLLNALGLTATEPAVAEAPVNGPPAIKAKVYPFAAMTEEAYSAWVAELLRHKLSEHWGTRW